MRHATTKGEGRWLVPLAVLLLAAACGGGEGEIAIPVMRYHYVASHPAPAQTGPVTLEGVLEITASDEDSIAGVWEVPELQPEMDMGGRKGAAYEVMAHPTYFGILTHRLRPVDGEILCEGEYTWMADGGVERTLPVTCAISPEEGARPEMPAPRPDTARLES